MPTKPPLLPGEPAPRDVHLHAHHELRRRAGGAQLRRRGVAHRDERRVDVRLGRGADEIRLDGDDEIVGADDAVERGDVLPIDALHRGLGDRPPQRDERGRLGAAIEPVRRLQRRDERHAALREEPRELELIAAHEQRRTRVGEQRGPGDVQHHERGVGVTAHLVGRAQHLRGGEAGRDRGEAHPKRPGPVRRRGRLGAGRGTADEQCEGEDGYSHFNCH